MPFVVRAPDATALEAVAGYGWLKVIVGKHVVSLTTERIVVRTSIRAWLKRALFNVRVLV